MKSSKEVKKELMANLLLTDFEKGEERLEAQRLACQVSRANPLFVDP